MNIGKIIKAIRTQAGMTQAELCSRCSISQTSMSQIENGYKKTREMTMAKICRALNISESLIYILAMQIADIPESKKELGDMLWPTLQSLILQLISDEFKTSLVKAIMDQQDVI
ncbi:MAG: hypothetical protein BGO69_08655 [Bacteroidetes bacterium 46-16]|mgnify:CR=1 FL=1|nr:MAG: hypothetical protein BGO69_08655 [Bacteroidetes bacterium 46-16]